MSTNKPGSKQMDIFKANKEAVDNDNQLETELYENELYELSTLL